jgi:hypothetical protein
VNQWEQEVVLQALKAANISVTEPCNLSDIPPGVLFHILNNTALCIEDSHITTMLRRNASGIVQSLASYPIPGGLLALAVDKEEKIRTWAQAQLAASKFDIFATDFKMYYSSIVETLIDSCGNTNKATSFPLSLVPDHSLWGHVAQALQVFSSTLIREGTAAQKVIGAFKRAMRWIHDGKECWWSFLEPYALD